MINCDDVTYIPVYSLSSIRNSPVVRFSFFYFIVHVRVEKFLYSYMCTPYIRAYKMIQQLFIITSRVQAFMQNSVRMLIYLFSMHAVDACDKIAIAMLLCCGTVSRAASALSPCIRCVGEVECSG